MRHLKPLGGSNEDQAPSRLAFTTRLCQAAQVCWLTMERGGALLALVLLVACCVALGYRRLHAAPSAAPPRSWRTRESTLTASPPSTSHGRRHRDRGRRPARGVLPGHAIRGHRRSAAAGGTASAAASSSRRRRCAGAGALRRPPPDDAAALRISAPCPPSGAAGRAAGRQRGQPCAWQARIQREFSVARRVLASAAAMQRNWERLPLRLAGRVPARPALRGVVGDTTGDGAAALVDALVDDGVGCNLVLRHERLRGDFARVMARLNVTRRRAASPARPRAY